ncbi:hypothetical protein SNE40_015885 [Patella caerulea]|uniref:Peptidyl-prolyl cis-trans isomerase n=1 Tax=Patella caerulea TaxID=87958 RepID=A0AAN8JBN8_PATCE
MSVIIETSLGSITVDLFTDERPNCSKNFLKLCKIKYYNFSLFHSVQSNLVAQTGDPTGTGKGGESVFSVLYGEQARYFDMEAAPRIKHKQSGLVSMVNNGDGKHGSQFFITLGENLDYLDNIHSVFGEVVEGLDVLKKINEAYCDEDHRPYRDIRIYHTIILDDPFDDPAGLQIPDRSPEPTKEMLSSDRIGADEEIDDTKGRTEEEIKEMLEEKEEKANAQILEMVGDLPTADVAPDDNVLFVCKLNPVTTGEDLEMIFSRFGKINSCDVIKDQKTGESLQYAFIEFESTASCENAYFKMDNVLIDDRRIHVDFSQSVSKLRKSGKLDKFDDKKGDIPSKYVLKDQSRKSHGYDLVFENDDVQSSSKQHKKGKKNKKKDSNSDSDLEKKHHKKKSKHKEKAKHRKRSRSRSRSRSVDEDRYRKNKRDRSGSPQRHYSSKYGQNDRRDKYRNDSTDRERRRSRERDYRR